MSLENALNIFESNIKAKHNAVLTPEQLRVIRLSFEAGFKCGYVDMEEFIKTMPFEKALAVVTHPAIEALVMAKQEIADLKGLLAIEKAKNSSR